MARPCAVGERGLADGHQVGIARLQQPYRDAGTAQAAVGYDRDPVEALGVVG